MLRSLFIGILILSALTAKGAETQVAENINNMPSDALYGFSGTVPGHAEKIAMIVTDGARKAFFSCDTIDGRADGLLYGKTIRSAVIAWFENNCRRDCQPGRQEEALPEQACFSTDEAFFCVSGLSPPCFFDGE
ncbi:MAG: hypothetical protein ACM3XR_03510 [Bacillota bacterium]